MVGHRSKYPQTGKLEMLTLERYPRAVQVNKAEIRAKWWKRKTGDRGQGTEDRDEKGVRRSYKFQSSDFD